MVQPSTLVVDPSQDVFQIIPVINAILSRQSLPLLIAHCGPLLSLTESLVRLLLRYFGDPGGPCPKLLVGSSHNCRPVDRLYQNDPQFEIPVTRI